MPRAYPPGGDDHLNLVPLMNVVVCLIPMVLAGTALTKLGVLDIQAPAVPLIANVRAEPVIEPGAIRRLLVEQVTGTVRWRESMANLAEGGVTEFWEIGAGKALSGMIKRIVKDATVRNIGAPADIAALKA